MFVGFNGVAVLIVYVGLLFFFVFYWLCSLFVLVVGDVCVLWCGCLRYSYNSVAMIGLLLCYLIV